MKALLWEGDALAILDQTQLPFVEQYHRLTSVEEVAGAICRLEVRGAPAIGISAAFGFVLGVRSYTAADGNFSAYAQRVYDRLASTRPTAVNLFWALRRIKNKLLMVCASEEIESEGVIGEDVKNRLAENLLREAQSMAGEDAQVNRYIGEYGNLIIPEESTILTHCNTGALATSDYGTALGIVRCAHRAGKRLHVYVGETRPLLQGARLTAWELRREEIPMTLITDSMAGTLMYQKKIDLVLVGADRIASNGDTANKIGTYSLAVLAHEHTIPFYVAAPLSTVDIKLAGGEEIVIEERDGNEVRMFGGQAVTLPEVPVYNPSFDVTPARYIRGIVTEKGLITPPFASNILKHLANT